MVNSFLDIEGQFAECLGATLAMPVWVLGPFFLNNRDEEALAEHTDQYKPSPSLDENAVTAWLDDSGHSLARRHGPARPRGGAATRRSRGVVAPGRSKRRGGARRSLPWGKITVEKTR